MPGLFWLRLDKLASDVARAMKDYENYAATITQNSIKRFEKKTPEKSSLRSVFDILYWTSKQPNGEGFTVPELGSESSLLVTTGERRSCNPIIFSDPYYY